MMIQVSTKLNGKKILDRLTSLLFEEETAAGSPEKRKSPCVRPAPDIDASTDPLLARRLTDMLARRGHIVGGRIHILNLSKIAASFGSRWPAVADRVNHLVEGIIGRRLSAKDLHLRWGSGAHILLFNDLSEAEAKLKCALLAEEISAKLIGHDASMGMLEVHSAVVRVDGSLDAESIDTSTVLSDLVHRLEEQGEDEDQALGPAAAGCGDDGGYLGSLIDLLNATERQLAGLRAGSARPADVPVAQDAEAEDEAVCQRIKGAFKIFNQARKLLASSGEDTAPLVPVIDPKSPSEAETGRRRLAAVRIRLAHLLQEIELELKRRSTNFLDEGLEGDLDNAFLNFFYRPLWQVRLNVINAYCCQLALTAGTHVYSGQALIDQESDLLMTAAIDRVVLQRALADISVIATLPERSVLVVPVHYSTLSSDRRRRAYMAIVQAVAPAEQAFLVWEVVDLSSGLMTSALQQAATLLKPYGRAVLLRVDLDQINFDGFSAAGIYGVGVDVGGVALSEANLIQRLERFRVRSARHGLKAYGLGLSKLSLTTAAVAAGFDHIGGDAVAPLVDGPHGIQTFKVESIFQALMSSTHAEPVRQPKAQQKQGGLTHAQ